MYIEKRNIGILGFGTVGSAIAHGFKECANIMIYDKYNNVFDMLFDTVNCSDYIFICVPTPTNDDGSQNISYVDDAIRSVVGIATSRKAIILCSTVLPGTTRMYHNKFKDDHDFVYCPEFITDRSAIVDFVSSKRFVIAGQHHARQKVIELYRLAFPSVKIYEASFEVAELLKYLDNCFFAVKLSYLNEVYDIVNAMDHGSYNILKYVWTKSGYIEDNHCDVPGHDGIRGFGGKCLPKDLKAFIKWAEDNNLNIDMCKIADKVNERVRYGEW